MNTRTIIPTVSWYNRIFHGRYFYPHFYPEIGCFSILCNAFPFPLPRDCAFLRSPDRPNATYCAFNSLKPCNSLSYWFFISHWAVFVYLLLTLWYKQRRPQQYATACVIHFSNEVSNFFFMCSGKSTMRQAGSAYEIKEYRATWLLFSKIKFTSYTFPALLKLSSTRRERAI